MKYCTHCGAQMNDEAVVCVSCGCSASPRYDAKKETQDILQIVIKVFLILGCVSVGWALIPLAWCIPMTVSVFNSFRDHRPISTGMKICVLIFVNIVAGICLLCMDESSGTY